MSVSVKSTIQSGSCLATQQIDCMDGRKEELKALEELAKLASYLVNAQG